MNKKTALFISSSAISISVIACAMVVAGRHSAVKQVNAGECQHEIVGHYEASDTSIEHWACCECHHAWADEDLTIEISENTTTDRSRIDFGSKQYAMAIQYTNSEWEWVKPGTVVYDAKYNFAHSVTDSNMSQAFISTISEHMDPLDEGKYYYFEITNNTDQDLNAIPVNRGWGSPQPSTIIAVGETKIVSASWTLWNGDENKKGPCIHLTPVYTDGFSGNITFSFLQIVDADPNYYSKVALVPSWDYLGYETIYTGGLFGFNARLSFTAESSEVFFESKDITTELAEGKYYMVQVTNDTNAILDAKMVGREWGGTAGNTFTLAIGETAIVYASSETWNSQTKKGVALRLAPHSGGTFSGTLTASTPVIVDAIPAPTLFARLDVQDNDWHSIPVNLVYDNTYGYCFSFNGANGPHIWFRTVVELDPAQYSQVNFHLFNGGTTTGNIAAWSEDWNDHGNGFATLEANSWVDGRVLVDTWNGDRNSCDVGLYDVNFNGLVKLSFGELQAI